MSQINHEKLAQNIKQWGKTLGFQEVGIADVDLSQYKKGFQDWLEQGFHGEMDYMARHGDMRFHPEQLHPGTLRVITVRMDYLPEDLLIASTLSDPTKGYISRYALGRDYHKVLRARLKKLAQQIQQACEELDARPFVDTGPLLERPLAQKSGIGWIGKNSLLLNKEAGSFFFLGELLINLPLPVDQPQEDACGSCQACLQLCPTQAIVSPGVVDSRRCISYLTIEFDGVIPEEFRAPMGNRIYGCDDCQLVCPWNREAQASIENDFKPRNELHSPQLLELFTWTEDEFLSKTQGSPIRRIGHRSWLRNIAIALGNAPASEDNVDALKSRLAEADPILTEHLEWAIEQQTHKLAPKQDRAQARLIRLTEKGLEKSFADKKST